MKFGLRKGWVILLCVLPFCVSCGDAELLDTNKWADKVEGWEPGIKGAIAWGAFELWDFLQDSTKEFRVELEEDSSLVVRYTQENIDSIKIAEVFGLKGAPIEFKQSLKLEEMSQSESRESLNSEGYKLSFDELSEELPLPTEFAGSDLKQITLSKVLCSCRLSGLDGLKYEVAVIYKSGEDESRKEIWDTLMKVDKPVDEVTLENKTFDLLSNKIHLKVDVFLKEVGTLPENLSIQVTFSDYDFSEVRGNIVKTGGIEIAGDFDMDMDILNDIKGTIWFTNPKVELVIKNKGFGVPLGVDMTFVGTNKNGEKASLALNTPLEFAGNSSDTETVWDTLSVNKDNSNIVDFLASLPRGKMNYSGTVTVNPDEKENDCVIYKNGSLGMDLNVVVPVELKVDSLSYGNTVNNVNIDSKYADKIKEGKISLNVQENGLPLDLSIPKMVLLGERNVPLDTIAVENDGIIEAGQGGTLSFKVDEGVAKSLGKTRSILLEAAVFGATEEPVKVKANARLKFTLMLEAKAAISDFNDFK